MALRSVSFLGLIWISSLIGGVFSLPVKGFGSNNPSPAWSDFSSPGSAYHVGQDFLGYIFGRVLKEYYRQEPPAWSPQNSDAKADGGVHSNYDWDMDIGDSGEDGGMHPGSYDYHHVHEGHAELVPAMEELFSTMEELFSAMEKVVSVMEEICHGGGSGGGEPGGGEPGGGEPGGGEPGGGEPGGGEPGGGEPGGGGTSYSKHPNFSSWLKLGIRIGKLLICYYRGGP
ncbi:uncharacterized protein LOC115557538 [Gadus morhua]|uniref:uncharacterized protein LOC115557538 n=1 Tax=Gadus morhua TaxID=8049 RepID=UPI0011B5CB5E|nr:uncharacterized protein LOC115557538 [Gadus morhua]